MFYEPSLGLTSWDIYRLRHINIICFIKPLEPFASSKTSAPEAPAIRCTIQLKICIEYEMIGLCMLSEKKNIQKWDDEENIKNTTAVVGVLWSQTDVHLHCHTMGAGGEGHLQLVEVLDLEEEEPGAVVLQHPVPGPPHREGRGPASAGPTTGTVECVSPTHLDGTQSR